MAEGICRGWISNLFFPISAHYKRSWHFPYNGAEVVIRIDRKKIIEKYRGGSAAQWIIK
jgi:hypothetical protein